MNLHLDTKQDAIETLKRTLLDVIGPNAPYPTPAEAVANKLESEQRKAKFRQLSLVTQSTNWNQP